MISRLYRMKQKSRTLQLKVAVDDKIFEREGRERDRWVFREKESAEFGGGDEMVLDTTTVANREGDPSLG
ncbi:hypothetical protein HanPI659440_Chr11g0436881 [Helianthus annuus]|nr:hypothetical protein HanPI659440_Chr11g0436881 [Helianthus annuus]